MQKSISNLRLPGASPQTPVLFRKGPKALRGLCEAIFYNCWEPFGKRFPNPPKVTSLKKKQTIEDCVASLQLFYVVRVISICFANAAIISIADFVRSSILELGSNKLLLDYSSSHLFQMLLLIRTTVFGRVVLPSVFEFVPNSHPSVEQLSCETSFR